MVTSVGLSLLVSESNYFSLVHTINPPNMDAIEIVHIFQGTYTSVMSYLHIHANI